jgi:pyruvate dehydrogenase (quinone)
MKSVGKRGVSVVVIPGDVALQPAIDAPHRNGAGFYRPSR